MKVATFFQSTDTVWYRLTIALSPTKIILTYIHRTVETTAKILKEQREADHSWKLTSSGNAGRASQENPAIILWALITYQIKYGNSAQNIHHIGLEENTPDAKKSLSSTMPQFMLIHRTTVGICRKASGRCWAVNV